VVALTEGMEISERESQPSYLDEPADLASEESAGSHLIPVGLSPVPLEGPPASGPGPSASDGPRVVDSVTVDPSETTRILLVDDVTLNLEILRETLRPLGHTLVLATSGRECLALARQSPPALILLDVMMPEMDGLEVCRQLKGDPALKHVPIIFCSALDDTAAKVRGLDAGAVDFIAKPYEPTEVVARVNTPSRALPPAAGARSAQQRAGARADPGLRTAPGRASAHAGGAARSLGCGR